ncbi:MAG: type II CRISPR-associated endonuclease Cas1, partial [Alphaproteobacteria bacterium]|nr:type II CRISPR-associated endonuclease Cas1 [Alphaproteobacteria bacterium]
KSIIQQKILNQAKVLDYFFPEHKNIERLKWLSKETLSNDAKNHEAQAASIYFKSLYGKHFVRDRLNDDANILLNYSYTVLRAMVARAVSGNGLLPYIGIKHCNKTNPLPLVDDLMEPFRPIADKFVFEELNRMVNIDNITLTPEIKRNLASIITYPVETIKGTVSLSDAIYDFVTSIVVSYELKKVAIQYPKII